jgi:septal ring factor EnvC (AmiA/AmiB activator)
VAKPNYSFEKRQRELEKKKKKEEKLQRKLARGSEPQADAAPEGAQAQAAAPGAGTEPGGGQ